MLLLLEFLRPGALPLSQWSVHFDRASKPATNQTLIALSKRAVGGSQYLPLFISFPSSSSVEHLWVFAGSLRVFVRYLQRACGIPAIAQVQPDSRGIEHLVCPTARASPACLEALPWSSPRTSSRFPLLDCHETCLSSPPRDVLSISREILRRMLRRSIYSVCCSFYMPARNRALKPVLATAPMDELTGERSNSQDGVLTEP